MLKLLYKNDKRHQKKQIELLRDIGSTEPFLEAAPSIIIMTIIWVSLGDNIYTVNSIDCSADKICTSFDPICTGKKNSCAVFGGFGGSDDVSTVAQFKEDSWTKLGDLNQRRSGLNCILFGSEVLVVGGRGSL